MPTILKGNTVFDVVTYTGNGGTQSITGLNFTPDLVWIKGRSGATDHAIYDAVRGVTIDLASNTTAAETTQTGGVTSFNSNGFSIGSLAKVNTNGATYTAWCWNAGGTTVTNTAGTITSQVRANAAAGISVVSYTGNGNSASTVGHGLGVAPSVVIAKSRSATDSWVFYTNIVDGSNDYLLLNTTGAKVDSSHSAPTSTVFNPNITMGSGVTCIAYCFAPVSGFSAFGSYTGNGSADGPFVFCNFSPKWVMVKCTSASGTSSNWVIHDRVRNTYNVMGSILLPNLSNAEMTDTSGAGGYALDFLSNGFKIRTNNDNWNTSSGTYIYAAFASNPFLTSRAQ